MRSTSHLRLHAPVLWGIALLAAACLTFGTAAQASATDFHPNYIISNNNMRDYNSMTRAEIQAFLQAQTGSLASLVTSDHDEVITLSKTKNNWNTTPDKGEARKPASQIIWEACQAWKINPKVMLTMLQKEQSLLTTPPRPGSTTLARAVGAGCPGSLVFPRSNPIATNRYPGFGNQVWHGARLLDGYGEGKNGSTIPLFWPGISYPVYGGHSVHPADLATYKLYVYNPSIGARAPYGDLSTQSCSGNANFWKIYRRYFGGTYSNPRIRRVYRFRNRLNGTYLYTASAWERYHLSAKHRSSWAYTGAVFSVDTSVATTATVPVYRFYNRKTHKYSFIRSAEVCADRRSASGRRTWSYGGVAFRVSGRATASSVTVYRMHNKRNGANLLTASKQTVVSLRRTATLRRTWSYEGITFYMPRGDAVGSRRSRTACRTRLAVSWATKSRERLARVVSDGYKRL